MSSVHSGRGWPSSSCWGLHPIHPQGVRRPDLSLALGEPGANVPLVSSPLRLESDPVSTRFKGPARQFQPLGGAGRRRGWCGSQKSPSHSRPALRRDGQLALKVRDRLSQLTLSPGTRSSGSGRTRKLYPVSLPFCGHKRPPSRPGAPAPDRGSWSWGCGSFSGSQ